jgi:uncharacterized cupredoxin-like copper-binding protein
MSRKRWLLVVLLAGGLAALALLAAACGDDGEEAGGGPTAGEEPDATTIGVSLIEWSVVPDEMSAPAGTVTFEVTNEGEMEHEFVIVRSDAGLADLPVAADGAVDEAQVEVVGEIEEMAPGSTESASFDLEPGNYILICNLVEEMEGEVHRHYQQGMRIPFEVTA